MNLGRKSFLLAAIVGFCSVHGSAQDVRKAWQNAFKACGQSELAGKKVLFFGTSNTVGIGSVWRKSTSGYNLRFDLPKLIPDQAKRDTIVSRGTPPPECGGNHTTGWSSALGLPFLSVFADKTGFDANFSHAKHAVITVDKIAFDQISELDFEQAIADRVAANPNDIYVRDATANDRLVMNKAFRVSGITVTFDYTPDQLKDLKTKYPEGGSITVGGDKGATVSFTYSNTSTLTLKTSGDVYIAGEFAVLTGGHVGLPGNQKVQFHLTPVDSKDVKIGAVEGVTP